MIEGFDHVTVMNEHKPLSTVRDIRNPSEININNFNGLRRRTTQSGFKGMGWLYSQEAAYCSNIKYNTINLLLNNNNKCVVYTDVDTIVRGDITNITTHVDSHDMGMYICPEEKEKDITIYGDKYTGWHAGIIIANNTSLTRKFINVVEERVTCDMYNMEADEDEFDYVYRTPEFQDLKIKSIDKMYKDSGPEFASSSLMWSGQADNKESNRQYIAEYLKYEQTT